MGGSSIARSQETGENSIRSLRTKSGSSIVQSRPDHVQSRASAIQTSRVLLCVMLLILAAVLGLFVYFFLSAPEEKLALEQFESIAGRAKTCAQQMTQLKRLGVITMATIISIAHPDAENWPFVLVDGYDEIASRLVQTISGDGIGLAPIVLPEELSEFESFAYDSYYGTLGYPNTTAVSDFGRGVWAKDVATDEKYHEGTIHPDGSTTYSSPYNIFVPILQHSEGANADPLMLNLHNEKHRGQTIDSIIACTKNYSTPTAKKECGQMTDLLMLTQRKMPASLIMQPIFPANDPTEITGIVSSPLNWQDVLDNAFGTEVNGIHCVLTSRTGIVYTYHVMGGEVTVVGEGDAHEKEFGKYGEEVIFTDEESGLYSESSFSFTLKLYPTEVFMATYRTDNPMWGAIICVVIISFTAIVFGMYDHNVRGEFTFKNELLEAKRNFTRFLSHEVRTPLNSIYMGMVLMREELEKAMRDSKKVSSSVSDNNNGKSPPVSHHRLSEWKGMADDILENSQNAVDVLNDLLNYDKITTGSLKLELSLLEINILKDHAQKGFKLTAAKKQIDVLFEDNASLRYTKNNLCIVGDNSRLIQVIRNLMSNALKFTPPKGNVKVTFSWVQELPDSKKISKGRQQYLTVKKKEKFTLKKGEKVSFSTYGFFQLSVTDTGAGMSQDQMSNVFEEGTQFNANELQAGQGSGLGMYIAKGIMNQHLGSLTVSSEGLGKGTVFTMTVPVYRDTKESDENEDLESDDFHFEAPKAITQPPQHLRILVVDDSDTNRKFLTRILENHGHTCDQARDGSIAVEMVSESMKRNNNKDKRKNNDDADDSKHYDAVMLDYEMPTMNGPTAAKKMRDLGSDTFIVGITGNMLPEDIEHFRSQGANEVLPKPFNISDLGEIFMEYGVGFRGK